MFQSEICYLPQENVSVCFAYFQWIKFWTAFRSHFSPNRIGIGYSNNIYATFWAINSLLCLRIILSIHFYHRFQHEFGIATYEVKNLNFNRKPIILGSFFCFSLFYFHQKLSSFKINMVYMMKRLWFVQYNGAFHSCRNEIRLYLTVCTIECRTFSFSITQKSFLICFIIFFCLSLQFHDKNTNQAVNELNFVDTQQNFCPSIQNNVNKKNVY